MGNWVLHLHESTPEFRGWPCNRQVPPPGVAERRAVPADADSVGGCATPGPGRLPETGTSGPACSDKLSALQKALAAFFLALFPLAALADDIGRWTSQFSHFPGWDGSPILCWRGVKAPGIPAFMDDTTDPRALAIVCPGGLRCVLSHTRAQPESLVT